MRIFLPFSGNSTKAFLLRYATLNVITAHQSLFLLIKSKTKLFYRTQVVLQIFKNLLLLHNCHYSSFHIAFFHRSRTDLDLKGTSSLHTSLNYRSMIISPKTNFIYIIHPFVVFRHHHFIFTIELK
jgi:hypothetical protein